MAEVKDRDWVKDVAFIECDFEKKVCTVDKRKITDVDEVTISAEVKEVDIEAEKNRVMIRSDAPLYCAVKMPPEPKVSELLCYSYLWW